MATRAMILRRMPDGKYLGIYNHFDGYIEGLGRMLRDYYNTVDSVNSLLSMGNVRTLGKSMEPFPTKKDEFSNEYSEFFIRDKYDNIEENRAKVYENLDEVKRKVGPSVSYWYIFENDKWYFTFNNKKLRVLRQGY